MEADIVANGSQASASEEYLYYLFAHEVGHTWGLGHVYDTGGNPNASTTTFQTMGYNVNALSNPGAFEGFYLGLGDAAGILRSYDGY